MDLRVVSYLFLAVFFVSAAIHLARCRARSPKSARTKPLLVSSLVLVCAFAVQPPPWLLLAALFACWLGDVLLMPNGNAWFVAGGVSFLAGHILFLFVYLPYIRWRSVPLRLLLPAAAVYLAAALWVMHTIRAGAPRAMKAPLFLYLAANGTMNVFALALLAGSPSLPAAAAFLGAALFFTSDCLLFLSRYWEGKERIRNRGFWIMATYISGTALIALGVLSLGSPPGAA